MWTLRWNCDEALAGMSLSLLGSDSGDEAVADMLCSEVRISNLVNCDLKLV